MKSNKMQLLKNKMVLNSIDFADFIKNLRKNNTGSFDNYSIPNGRLILPFENDSLSIQFHLTAISGLVDEKDSIKINNISAHVLIKHK
jgi:hypothetical protein